MLSHDYNISYGYSVMGWLYTWFGVLVNKYVLIIIAAVLLFAPLLKTGNFSNYYFRLIILTSLLIWLVIFNHKAESPTFIIAMAGASIWFVSSDKSDLNIVLFILAIIFTSLSPTDLFPQIIREKYTIPYSLKVFPMILIWIKINFDIYYNKYLIPEA